MGFVGDSGGFGSWWTEEPVAGPGSRGKLLVRWGVPASFFLLLAVVPGATDIAHRNESPGWLVIVVSLSVVYGALYVVAPSIYWAQPTRSRVLITVGMLICGWVLVGLLGLGSLSILIYAMGVTAMLLPVGWVLVLNGGSVLGAALTLLVADGSADDFGQLVTVASVSLALFFLGRLIRAVRGLKQANAEIATLAATQERARLARELHDLLGHSLTTITVKAGLARRVLESSGGDERAIDEIHGVEGLARRALGDVRATVSEYREVSLSAELVGAKAALRAAELEADFPYAVDNVRTDLQTAFGYVLREAVTNAIRHSGARRVAVRFGATWMKVEDNGDATVAPRQGNGLTGLAERLSEIGGSLRVEPNKGGGLTVVASVSGLPDATTMAVSPALPAARAAGQA